MKGIAAAPVIRTLAFATLLLVGASCADRTDPLSPIVNARQSASLLATHFETFYGPQRFTRVAGPSQTVNVSISTAGFGAPFVLHIRNGDEFGANPVDNGSVDFNGVTMVDKHDLNKTPHEYSFPVNAGATAQLVVHLAGKPGGVLDIWLEGIRLPTLFCPEGGFGAYTSLSAAVAATPVDGTIQVCDGVHILDNELINKPLTIRSQHPGGATIEDADPAPTLQGGRPAIRIDSIPSGLVRFVDLSFATGGRGVVLGRAKIPPFTGSVDDTAQFDQVQFDSTHWVGRNLTTSLGIMIFDSSVPGAHVELTHSDMSDITLGLFVVAAVETDAQFNTFNRVVVSGTDYSFGFPSGSSAFGTIEDNVYHACRVQGCIRTFGNGAITIARNQMDGTTGVSAQAAILIADGGAAGPASQPKIIQDNVVTGALFGIPTLIPSYTFQSGISVTDNPGTQSIVTGNQVTNVGVGVTISADVDAHDNVMTNGVLLFRQLFPRTVSFRRNDGNGLTSSFQRFSGAVGDYTCNWWGQATGPIAAPFGTTALYTPFATAPIAGTANTCP